MTVLIVESNRSLADLWAAHLARFGRHVIVADGQSTAIAALRAEPICVMVLDVTLGDGSAFAVADYASYRHPKLKILFVTSRSFFSDGSIFRHAANACAYLPTGTRPDDLALMVDHYAAAR